MPLYTRHDETGWIDGEGSWPVLRRDGGGRWRLSTSRPLSQDWFGKRVRVVGVRVDFGELEVVRIEPLD